MATEAYRLYYADDSAAMGVRVLLEEIGAPYELIPTTIDIDKPRPPEQLALNPNGWVPVLIYGNRAMYECAAITVFLCDQIGKNNWVLGDHFSAADIYLFMLTTWLSSAHGHPGLDEFPNVKRVAEAVMSRPSVRLVYTDWIAHNE